MTEGSGKKVYLSVTLDSLTMGTDPGVSDVRKSVLHASHGGGDEAGKLSIDSPFMVGPSTWVSRQSTLRSDCEKQNRITRILEP